MYKYKQTHFLIQRGGKSMLRKTRKNKKLIILLIACTFLISLPILAQATIHEDHEVTYLPLDQNDTGIEILAVDACPGRGDHEMFSRGWGTLIQVNSDGSKETIFSSGACWQCKWCHEVLVTEYDPLQTRYVGYYAMRNPGYQIGNYGIIMEASPAAIKFTSGRSVPYCKLFYN